jgi:hypothetical protein
VLFSVVAATTTFTLTIWHIKEKFLGKIIFKKTFGYTQTTNIAGSAAILEVVFVLSHCDTAILKNLMLILKTKSLTKRVLALLRQHKR